MTDRHLDSLLKKALQVDEKPSSSLLRQVKVAVKEGGSTRVHKSTPPIFKRLLPVALFFAIVISAAAFGANFLGAQDLLLPNNQAAGVVGTEDIEGKEELPPVALITLQGFVGSPEHSAAVRWQNFLDSYDMEATLAQVGNDPDWGGVPPAYWVYGAYSMEMVEEIRAIAAYYNLSLVGEMLDIHTSDELLESIAYGPIFTDDSIWFSGWQFESGNFRLEGGFEDMIFSMTSSRKGVFFNMSRNIQDPTAFTQWNFKNIHGQTVLLAQSPFASLLIKETETAFIVVSLVVGVDPITPSCLEAFANVIHFENLRTEVPDLRETFQEQRELLNASVYHLVGTWRAGEHELIIRDDRSVRFTNSESARTYSGANPLLPGGWSMNGEISPNGQGSFLIEIHAMMSHSEDSLPLIDNWWKKTFYYDGYLHHTDWEGVALVFTRQTD